MPVVSITTDRAALTLTAIGEYPVSVERLWAVWADPRQLERFWGPPAWPATFTRHELTEGGRSDYFMSGPHGEQSHGYWRVRAAVPGRYFEVEDGFANPDGSPADALPGSSMRVTFEATPTGARFVAVSTFASLEALEQLLGMGMAEGLTQALGQMDDVLADLRAHAAAWSTTEAERVGDRAMTVRRVVRGSLTQVFEAHRDPALVQRWLLGPEGWTMPVCEIGAEVGSPFRHEWVNAATGERFGFEGEHLEIEAPWRIVTTERMIGMEGPGNRNELRLVPQPGGHTLLELTITCPSPEVCDAMLGSGMLDGMEASYGRLQEAVG